MKISGGPQIMEQAVCYIRMSTEEQAKGGVSLAAQEEKLLAYCQLTGLEPVAMIREEGVSGGKLLGARPGGAELLALVAARKAQHIVALKLDRLFRDAADALNQTKTWDKGGVALHLVDMGGQTLNTASAMGRFFLNVMAGFAELERNLIAERTGTAMAHKKAHREAYAPTPYGYDREGNALKENPGELANVAQIQAWRTAGWTLGEIAQELTRRQIPTKRGGSWYPGTVKYLLENNLYAGVA
jgi:DNA invertase Pin-like site-specific DNA recombinase